MKTRSKTHIPYDVNLGDLVCYRQVINDDDQSQAALWVAVCFERTHHQTKLLILYHSTASSYRVLSFTPEKFFVNGILEVISSYDDVSV